MLQRNKHSNLAARFTSSTIQAKHLPKRRSGSLRKSSKMSMLQSVSLYSPTPIHILMLMLVNPPYFVGPNAPCQSIRPGAANALSSNLLLYNLLIPESKLDNFTYGIVDVKDVAAALVAGIRTPGRNRILLSGEWFEIKDALELIANARPELKDRLITHIGPSQPRVFVDNTRAYEILGLKPVGSWKDNLLETIDYLVKLEKDWVEVGVDIETKLKATFWRK